METYLCSDGDRLDGVVWMHYASLEPMGLVLEANPHLLERAELSVGDVVTLPFWAPPVAKAEARTLW